MSSPRYNSNDTRRQVGSPRPKGGRGLVDNNSKDTLCRNILIYGKCRFEHQGCAFRHETGKDQSPDLPSKKLTGEAPAFTPSAPKMASFTSHNVASAPSFTPRGPGVGPPVTQSQSVIPQQAEMDHSAYSQSSGHLPDYSGFTQAGPMGPGTDAMTTMQHDFSSIPSLQSSLSPIPNYGVQYGAEPTSMLGPAFEAFQSRTYHMATPAQPPLYHMYAPVGPEPVAKGKGNVRTAEAFVNNDIREEIQKMQAASLQVMPASSLPVTVGDFTALVPLDTTTQRRNLQSFGFNSWVYKAFSTKNGRPFFLRRLEEFQLSNQSAVRRTAEWRSIWSGNIVHIEDAFTTKEFGDNSIVFVQDFYPLSKTLVETHFNPSHTQRYPRSSIPEPTLWSYLVQLTNALKTIHAANLAARCIEPSKIIVTDSKGRIRLSGCAILDAADFDARKSITALQDEDLEKVGRVLLSLMMNNIAYSNSTIQGTSLQNALIQAQRSYKPQLCEIVNWLVVQNPNAQFKTVQELMTKMHSRVFDEFDASLSRQDRLRYEMGREVESGRIARLLMKMNLINDRPEYQDTQKFPETESRYINKLFADYVFHQVDQNGTPLQDLGHIMDCLNKLDAGTDEQICLTTNNGSIIIISFAEIKKHMANAWVDLVSTAGSGPSGPVTPGGSRSYQH